MRKLQLNEVILRWKKTTRALKLPEQEYGRYITDILERRTDAELVHFSDTVEAATFFCLLELVKEMVGVRDGCELPLPSRNPRWEEDRGTGHLQAAFRA